MKSFITALLCLITSVTAFPQSNTSPEKKQKIKQELKKEFKMSDFQVDSILSIQNYFEDKDDEIKKDAASNADKKKEKLKQQVWLRKERMRTVCKETEIDKVEAFYEKVKNG